MTCHSITVPATEPFGRQIYQRKASSYTLGNCEVWSKWSISTGAVTSLINVSISGFTRTIVINQVSTPFICTASILRTHVSQDCSPINGHPLERFVATRVLVVIVPSIEEVFCLLI